MKPCFQVSLWLSQNNQGAYPLMVTSIGCEIHRYINAIFISKYWKFKNPVNDRLFADIVLLNVVNFENSRIIRCVQLLPFYLCIERVTVYMNFLGMEFYLLNHFGNYAINYILQPLTVWKHFHFPVVRCF